MSKMNLQKLRQICHSTDSNHIEMDIPLPANDPLNRVEFTDDQGNNHTLQAISIHSHSSGKLTVVFSTEEEFSVFEVGEAFLPRLKQILVEHGFHSGYLPHEIHNLQVSKKVFYNTSYEFEAQIVHACYDDGRSMRKAVEYQAKLNKT